MSNGFGTTSLVQTVPTWFLSMWISNTATTSMMLPILEAVLEQLGEMKEFQVDEDQANARR